jgi:hypothetical protein
MVCPIVVSSGRRSGLFDAFSGPAQAKHDIGPIPFGFTFLRELRFEAIFDPRRIVFLIISCRGVTENRGNAFQFSAKRIK